MAYLGRGWWAVAYFVIGFSLNFIQVLIEGPNTLLVTGLILVGFNTIGAIHGYRAARDYPRENYPLYARWYGVIPIFFVLPIVVVSLFKSIAYQPFTIPSNSNVPTLESGDYAIASKFAYGYGRYSLPVDLGFEGSLFHRSPTRGDVVIFKLPDNPSTDYVKRLVGLPGDRVQLKGGSLFLNGQLVPREPAGTTTVDSEVFQVFRETIASGRSYDVAELSDNSRGDNTREFTVPDGQLFFLGDNRDNSVDSRYDVGYVPIENAYAKVVLVYSNRTGSWHWVD